MMNEKDIPTEAIYVLYLYNDGEDLRVSKLSMNALNISSQMHRNSCRQRTMNERLTVKTICKNSNSETVNRGLAVWPPSVLRSSIGFDFDGVD